jgi:hypothetical protein
MALLSDFFVATADEVNGLDLSQSPANRFLCLRARRTDVVKLVQLQCLVDGTRFQDHVRELDTLFVRSAGDKGPWVVIVPKPLVDALSESSDAQISALGRRWAETDEWVRDGGTPENIVPFLRDIVRLAQQSKRENKSLYIWISV